MFPINHQIYYLHEEELGFPCPTTAVREPNGLLAIGGDLSPDRLMAAYYNGIFPWFNEGDPILWWSPTPRAVFHPADYRPSRSLAKLYRKHPWRLTVNRSFDEVIDACAEPRANEPETWIHPAMIQAYRQLHRQGHAHSVEVWLNDELVGGLYGICVGRVFCGESMFHRVSGASKIAFWQAMRLFHNLGIELVDAQLENPHLMNLGAELVTRNQFLSELKRYRDKSLPELSWIPRSLIA
ncbi:leucyl/phenylalanyl-tRNA--protein transferase [Paraferrimonas sedimenticola]|uniref:leucyl/phenylalanyl-tRNA--protein transferase n=1 Tax=Paraferrimonas sedimenticola TaxID=375674 RepID=UPI0024E0FC9F|nr:leucyl/phenylalanyl-tRNA--protein transferase [Paraferrimonas sedimenticola]